jgi:alkanesulfonate monooxygenase SsuD/methylene tetrahydromethanopterin reductase-like flavin-dependent oxidoreductase (luciferase family)
MEEGLKIIKGLLAGGSFSFTGKHYKITDLEGWPLPVQKPHPPVLIGGGGRRMLSLAAREADIVNVNFDLREGRVSRRTARSGFADVTVEKLAWIKEAAGERFEHLELGAWVFMANVTGGREDVAAALATGFGAEARDVLEMPHFLIGTVDELVDDLRDRRERYGFSFVVVPGDAAEAFAPVVTQLSGT